jgi:hypothetical protein
MTYQRAAGSKLQTKDYQPAAGSPKPAAASLSTETNDAGTKPNALALAVDRVIKRITARQYASLNHQIFRAATSIPANASVASNGLEAAGLKLPAAAW